jgi:hydroxyacylglutathione hydrolase
MKPEVIIISIAPDNYCYLIRSNNDAAVIDPADSDTVMKEVEKRNLNLQFILATHHHSDHTAGIPDLKRKTGALVYGGDKRIKAIDKVFKDGRVFYWVIMRSWLWRCPDIPVIRLPITFPVVA